MLRRVFQSASRALLQTKCAPTICVSANTTDFGNKLLGKNLLIAQYATKKKITTTKTKKTTSSKSNSKAVKAEEPPTPEEVSDPKQNEAKAYEKLAEAHKALEANNFEKTIDIGRQLLEMNFSGGFEVIALALYHSGDLAAARAVLTEATQVVPSAWMFHQLLGNVLTELGKHDEAYKAYEKALAIEGSDKSFIRYCYAMALDSAQDYLKSYEQLMLVQALPEELQNDILRRKVICLFHMEKFTDAGELIAKNLKQIKQRMLAASQQRPQQLADEEADEADQNDPELYTPEDRFELSFFYSHLADSLRLCGQLPDKSIPTMYQNLSEEDRKRLVLDASYKALRFDKYNPLALNIILSVSNIPMTDKSRLYSIVIGITNSGKAPGSIASSTLTKYEVIADSPEEALTFIRPFEGKYRNSVKPVAVQIKLQEQKPTSVDQVFDESLLNMANGEKSSFHDFVLVKGVTSISDKRMRLVKRPDGRSQLVEVSQQDEEAESTKTKGKTQKGKKAVVAEPAAAAAVPKLSKNKPKKKTSK